METFVMVMIAIIPWSTGGVSINSIEFNNRESCNEAIKNMPNTIDLLNTFGSEGTIQYICVKK